MIKESYSTTLNYEVIREITSTPKKSVCEVKAVSESEHIESSSKMILSKISNSFQDEIFFATTLRHAYIPNVISAWKDEENTYILSEKIEGMTLSEIVSSRLEIPQMKKLMICIKIAEVLCYLHRGMDCSVIHGDISPNNIIITRDYIPYLIDFGSSFKSRRVAVKKVYSGTYGYFSPKLVGSPYLIDETVDIYSFGMIMKSLGLIDSSVEMYQLYLSCVSSSCEGIANGEQLLEELERLIL